MAAFIHQCLRGFVVFADLIQLDTDNVGLPEVGAKSTLPIVYVNHAGTSQSIKEHEPCQKLGLAMEVGLAPARWAHDAGARQTQQSRLRAG